MDNIYYRLGSADAHIAQLEEQLKKAKDALEDMNIILNATTLSSNKEFVMVDDSVIPIIRKYHARRKYV